MLESLAESLTGVRIEPSALKGPDGSLIGAARFKFFRQWYLDSKGRYYGEACPPLTGSLSIPAEDNKVPGQKNQSVYVDLYVPHAIPAGLYRGTITVGTEQRRVDVGIELNVFDLDMPDTLSYVIELNSYGFEGPIERFWAMHRLAHEHRLGYNVLSYGHCDSTSVPFIPVVEGDGETARVSDWTRWDRWMGPVLDGSAFKEDRKSVV